MGAKKELYRLIKQEAKHATKQYGAFKSPHEAYGVLKEEFEEWWESIKNDEESAYELLQVIAVSFRYLTERAKNSGIVTHTEEGYDLLTSIKESQNERWGADE